MGNPLLKPSASVVGRLVFPTPSMTFRAVADSGPPRYSRHCLPSVSLDRWTFTLLGFYLPFRALGGSLALALACTASLEIRSKVSPPPRSAACPLPGASSLRARGTTAWPCSAFVVSRHLDGFLHTSVCELVASHSRSGVHHVSCFPALHPLPKDGCCPAGTPRNAVRTLRSLSLVNSRTASLQPLPSCRSAVTSLREASFVSG